MLRQYLTKEEVSKALILWMKRLDNVAGTWTPDDLATLSAAREALATKLPTVTGITLYSLVED